MKTKWLVMSVAVTMALFAGAVMAEIPVPTGLNPATGAAWTNGDAYRLAFITSANIGSPVGWTIDDFNAHVQGLADAAGLGEAAWYVIGSTAEVDARDNTSTNPEDPEDPDCPILLVDGATIVATDNLDLWDGEVQNTISMDENGTAKDHWPFTGTYKDGTKSSEHGASFGDLGDDAANITQGRSDITTEWIWRMWTGDPPATLLPLYAMSEALFVGRQVSDPDPEYDATIDPINPLTLSWTNLDPNLLGDSVYVDVWFGTDPNKLQPLVYSKVVTAGENVSSAEVDASVIGTYYWQVDSYIYGPAHINEPNMIEGPVWKFNAISDLPPESVTIDTPDMITWSGKPVNLDATVVDDGTSELTYLWTATSNMGDTIVFTPGDDVEDPIVTITKDFSVIPIANPGFENPVLDDGDWDWSLGNQGWGYFANDGYLGPWNPTTDDFPDEAPEGDNVGWTNPGNISVPGGFAQVLTETFTANTTYTLTVEVGRSSYYSWGGYKVQLLAGGTPHDTTSTGYTGAVVGGNLLAEDDNSLNIAPDAFKTSTVVYTYDEVADANKVGEPLQIRLLCRGDVSDSDEAYFDDVRLTADPPRPVSGAVSTVELTLAVNDEFNPTPVTDSMTIDVYDTACLAARFGLAQAAVYPGDLDEDCDTDLADLAAVAEKWLSDTGLTEPVPK